MTKSEAYSEQLSWCSIRDRVAFMLANAEAALNTIKTSEGIATRIRTALDLAWRWEQVADVSGEALQEVLV